jgi:hypothetical protein
MVYPETTMTDDIWLQHAGATCLGPSDILSQLISRYASSAAKDSSFADKRALRQTIEEIAMLRRVNKELRARNTRLLSKIQEHEAREY